MNIKNMTCIYLLTDSVNSVLLMTSSKRYCLQTTFIN